MTTAQNVLGRAAADLGMSGNVNRITQKYGPNGWGISALTGGYDWCAISCYVWMREAGSGGLVSSSPFVRDHVTFHQNRGTWLGKGSTPKPGDEVVFSWDADGSVDHIGYVESVSGGTVYTIEGNSSNAVRRRSYPVFGSVIYGYGRPAYDGSSTAGDGSSAPLEEEEDIMKVTVVTYDQGPEDNADFASQAVITPLTGFVRTSNGRGSRRPTEAWVAIAGVLKFPVEYVQVDRNGFTLAQLFKPVAGGVRLDETQWANAVKAALSPEFSQLNRAVTSGKQELEQRVLAAIGQIGDLELTDAQVSRIVNDLDIPTAVENAKAVRAEIIKG